jgi:hypothetical protein
MSQFNTNQFLPEVFRSQTNQRFLGATMDQLVVDENNIPINGYIGRTLAPTYKAGDNYVPESNALNKNYQLEASVVVKDNDGNIVFNGTYIDLLYSIANKNGKTNNQQRLFSGEYYNYDGKFDYDKFVNYYNYYWLPNGPLDSSGNPTSVKLYSSDVLYNNTFTVTRNTSEGGYTFSGLGNQPNNQISLARGGVYTFIIDQPGFQFWIQSDPGVSGTKSNLPTVTTRQVLGVKNNGIDKGTIQFNVPQSNAQDFFVAMPIAGTVNAVVTNFTYAQIQNQLLSDFLNQFPTGLDGIASQLSGKSFIFYNSSQYDSDWTTPAPPSSFASVSTTSFRPGTVVPDYERTNGWTISLVPLTVDSANTDYLIQISPDLSVAPLHKVFISSGFTYASNQFWLNSNYNYATIPPITATSDYLYYQDSDNPLFVGKIKLVSAINVPAEILGKTGYVSPNGVIFTNGLKVKFDDVTIPAEYAGNEYYVDGVGTSISLTLVSQLIVPETFGKDITTQPDYITIRRDSVDQNAWSRYNRWFHKDVLAATAEYNNDSVNFGINLVAKRPIIEFEPNIQLFNYGSRAVKNVDLFSNSAPVTQISQSGTYTIVSLGNTSQSQWNALAGTSSNTYTVGSTFNSIITGNGNVAYYGTGVTTTDAFNQYVGQISANIQGVNLTTGITVIFANDYDTNIIEKVWKVNVQVINTLIQNSNYITLEDTGDAVTQGTNVLITQGSNAGKSFWYNSGQWQLSQQKATTNQAPLFDLFDSNGYSFGDGTVYPGTTFLGTENFSYLQTQGTNDPVLGFPLSYQNFTNVGDIQFADYYTNGDFTYTQNSANVTVKTSTGYLSIINGSLTNNWIVGVEPSKQYQVFSKFYDGKYITINATNYAFVQIDILPATAATVPYLKVFYNNKLMVNQVDYQLTTYESFNVVILLTPLESLNLGDKIDVLVYNPTQVSKSGYYEVPLNLDINPLNEPFYNGTITLGQLRTHYNKLVENTAGNKPLQDSFLKAQGGTLLQHSSPVLYATTFLENPDANFLDAINLARKEYTRFRNKFLNLCTTLKTLNYSDAITGVDTILQNINSVKNNTFPWYYSDMVPQGGTYKTITYSINNVNQTTYEINSLFNPRLLSNRAVLIYLNGQQLALGVDYTFSANSPAVIISRSLSFGDSLVIRDYANTDGNYIPETPSKLGLYPKFVPAFILDDTYQTPVTMIRGHDGSLTPAFGDFRDNYLLELELRIYNNIKTDYSTNEINRYDIIPGQFRSNQYALKDWNTLLTNNFLQWVGSNNVDYTTNLYYDANNPWTWNYAFSLDRITNSQLQGTWRAIYDYWYDTTRPHTAPWEMLGFSSIPSWWSARYGPAPYTKSNSVLWQDLENGFVYNDGNSYTDKRFARPGLSSIIPVDIAGKLLDPTQIPITGTVNYQTTGNAFAIGAYGPAEYAWRTSSDFPFAVQTAFALARPALYFATQIDTSLLYRNTITKQFSTIHNEKISFSILNVNGEPQNGTVARTSGYINWIADNIQNLGIDPVAKLKEFFTNTSVQLAYKLSGFSDSNLIEVFAEQTSPAAINSSIAVPSKNYKIYLNKGVPASTIVYSAVIVTKTNNGWSLSGYDVNYPYFTIIPSILNRNYTVTTINSASVKLYQDGGNTLYLVPYGTTFGTQQQVAEFLVSYQRFLTSNGFRFQDYDNDLLATQDFTLSIQEFLYWSQQGWAKDSIIVLNPVKTSLKLISANSVVDEITNAPNGNRILDQNFNPIQSNNFTILRDPIANSNLNSTTINIINDDIICFARLNLVSFEHVIVFDNIDDFNNIIYQPSLGTRQFRLRIVGEKTGNWTGALSAPGYVYSNPQIQSWQVNTDYQVGDIVSFNSGYYTAATNISATATFNPVNWIQISYQDIQRGLLPNFGYNAQKFLNFYDVDNPPQEKNLQLYSAGLIGFRERSYLTDLGISVPTQTKFYQGFVKEKGTRNAVNALTRANFDNVQGNITVYEEWAIQVGNYGNQNTIQFNEFVLDQTVFKTNPVALTLGNVFTIGNGIVTLNANVTARTESNVYNAGNLNTTTSSLYDNRTINSYITDLPYPGYVNVNDVDTLIFNLSNLSTISQIDLGVGNKIWSATSSSNNWNVYRLTESGFHAIEIIYNLDDYAQLVFDKNHNFSVNDIFVLADFTTVHGDYNGIYSVVAVVNNTSILIQVNPGVNTTNITTLIHNSPMTGYGIVYKFVSLRVANIAAVNYTVPNGGWITNDRVWIDNATPTGWGVYTYSKPWASNAVVNLTANTVTNNSYFGSACKISPDSNFVYVTAPEVGTVTVFANVAGNFVPNATITNTNSYFGVSIDAQNNIVVVGTTAGNVLTYINYGNGTITSLQSIHSANVLGQFGSAVSLSADAHYLYITEPGSNLVQLYHTANTTGNVYYSQIATVTVPNMSTAIASPIKAVGNGAGFFVGIPSGQGNVNFYQQSGIGVANLVSLTQTITAQNPQNSAYYGSSIDISYFGYGNVFIGAPGTIVNGQKTGIVERYIGNAIYGLLFGSLSYNSTITAPGLPAGNFGQTLKLSADGKLLAVGATTTSGQEITDFDNYPVFLDNGSTIFVDTIGASGAVYLYEPLLNLTNALDPGIYNLSQELETQVHSGDYFGSSIDLTPQLILVGSNGINNNSGQAYLFSNANATPAWNLTRSQEPQVDINSINRTFLYNNTNNSILATLDYLDPRKGKILNAFARDIDYIKNADPAVYNTGTSVGFVDNFWGPSQVSKIWWDVGQVFYIDYEQGDLNYRLNQWGAVIPGSNIAVYQWIESTVLPSQYKSTNGAGVALYPDDSRYSTYGYVDAGGNVHVNYYFWITDCDLVIGHKFNSVNGIIAGIESPQTQGIEYSTVLRNDTVALYNSQPYLMDKSTVLHLEKKSTNTGLVHNEYALVQEGNPQSQIPNSVLAKLIDSLSAQDANALPVPDPTLSPSQAYGLGNRPRQTMFVNVNLALTNYIQFVNQILLANPITENKLLTLLLSEQSIPNASSGRYNIVVNSFSELGYIDTSLQSAGYNVLVLSDVNNNGKWAIYTLSGTNGTWSVTTVQTYKTQNYWSYQDYYKPGFDSSSTVDTTVATLLDFGKLTLVPNTYVKILDTGDGNFAIYSIDNNLNKSLVAIGNGTVQLSTNTIPALELRQILTAVQTQLLVDDLKPYFNQLFFIMVKYALTEQKTIEWAFKTSFISATQQIRKLYQFPAWIPDNQTYYEAYIQEVKPYRTRLREFVIDYIGNDTYGSDVTDFDLIPYWDTKLQVYRSASGEQDYDTVTWSNPTGADSQWYNNYKYSVTGFVIENGGQGYTTAPQIIISGGGGSGATAHSVVDNGVITSVIVDTPGSGYTTYPSVIVNGLGSGASVRVILQNVYDNNNLGHNLIRSISTTIKFDRISYTVANSFIFWSNISTANIGQTIGANTIIVYNNSLYQLANNYTIDSAIDFPVANVVALSAGSLTNANDRIAAFNGNINIGALLSGIDYPGVIIDGNSFTGNIYDSNIQSSYTDNLTGNGTIIVDGGRYYDTFNSHAPEEFVPGIMFDNLDFEVYDTANLSYRITENMTSTASINFYNITSSNTTTLVQTLGVADNYIYVADAKTLPNPYPSSRIPGAVFINGEKINYYRNYSYNTAWTANLDVGTNSIISYDGNIYITTGNVWGALFANIASNVSLVGPLEQFGNALGQIRRAVDGTAVFNGELDYNLTVSAPITTNRDTILVLANTGAYGITTSSATGTRVELAGTSGSFASGHYLYQYSPGSLLQYQGNVYMVTGNIYEPTGNISNVTSQITQIAYDSNSSSKLGFPVKWAANLIFRNFSTNLQITSTQYAISTKVVDASLQQLIPSSISQITIGASPVTLRSAVNVSLGLRLSGTITANVGDYITQQIPGNVTVANLVVLGAVTNSNLVAVTYVSGQLNLNANSVYVNGVSANASSLGTYVLGTVSATGNVILASNTTVYVANSVAKLGNILLKNQVVELPYSIGSTQLGQVAPPLFLLYDNYLPVPSGFAP